MLAIGVGRGGSRRTHLGKGGEERQDLWADNLQDRQTKALTYGVSAGQGRGREPGTLLARGAGEAEGRSPGHRGPEEAA